MVNVAPTEDDNGVSSAYLYEQDSPGVHTELSLDPGDGSFAATTLAYPAAGVPHLVAVDVVGNTADVALAPLPGNDGPPQIDTQAIIVATNDGEYGWPLWRLPRELGLCPDQSGWAARGSPRKP